MVTFEIFCPIWATYCASVVMSPRAEIIQAVEALWGGARPGRSPRAVATQRTQQVSDGPADHD
jgi:hypothetical protein